MDIEDRLVIAVAGIVIVCVIILGIWLSHFSSDNVEDFKKSCLGRSGQLIVGYDKSIYCLEKN